MAFIADAATVEVARHALQRRDSETVEKAIVDRAELMQKALDFAEEDFAGEVPDQVHVGIFMDPTEYIGGAELEVSKDCVGYDEDVRKDYVGFDALVTKLKGEGHSEESARRIAASIGRAKYGAGFNKPASSHH